MADKIKIPDEVAQIVFNGSNQPTLILRYATEKKAKKHYEIIERAKRAGYNDETKEHLLLLEADMFTALVDVTEFSTVALVLHKQRQKFEPFV